MSLSLEIDPSSQYPAVYQPFIRAGLAEGFSPDEVYEAMRPVRRDSDYAELDIDGLDEPVQSWRLTTHRDWDGDDPHPAKGGIRFDDDVSEAETEELTVTMKGKNVLHMLPFDGGKGGVKKDPRDLEPEQRAQLARKHAAAHEYHPLHNVGATDINTLPEDMDEMIDEKTEEFGELARACFTGSTDRFSDLSGFRGRTTGEGASLVTDEYIIWRASWDPAMAKVLERGGKIAAITQGNGKAAGPFNANLPKNVGLKAVSEFHGALLAKSGFIDMDEANEIIRSSGGLDPEKTRISTGSNLEWIPNDEFWTTRADLLVPGALGHEVTLPRAEKLNGILAVIGIANNPNTPEAIALMEQMGIDDVIDRLANAGGVSGSYWEWVTQMNEHGGVLVDRDIKSYEQAWEQRMRSVARVTFRGVSKLRQAEAEASSAGETRLATIADAADRFIVRNAVEDLRRRKAA